MDDLGQRLLHDLRKCFRDDPGIDEYDFLPIIEPAVNKNPFVVVDHKLGIQAWAVKILFQYAYEKLLRSNVPNRFAICTWDDDSNCSRAVLMINAENQTAWNIRKQAVKNKLECPEEELKTNALILRKHPKSPESFAHRKWVLNHLKETGCSDIASCVEAELLVCSRAAEGYANNYNAWSHRIWVMENIAAWDTKVVADDLESTAQFTRRHISDHSGFHYRQQLLKRQPPSCTIEEQQHNSHAILRFPGHEALWYHRRALIHEILRTTDTLQTWSTSLHLAHPDIPHPDTKRLKLEADSGDSTDNVLCVELKKRLLGVEEEFCEEVLRADNVENAAWQKQLLTYYKRWLRKECGD